MTSTPKILVVGTTADYIQWIRTRCPGEALFLTDPEVRRRTDFAQPVAADELQCDLTWFDRVIRALERHLTNFGQHLTGITSFDCESMELTAALAGRFDLPYPSVDAVRNCRDKLRTKALWQAGSLNTSPARELRAADDAIRFQGQVAGPIVIKPVAGSGGELVMLATDTSTAARNFHLIRDGLRRRRHHRLYSDGSGAGTTRVMAEALVTGREFSCDFSVRRQQVRVLRLTEKIRMADTPFGVTAGYLLPARLPVGVDTAELERTLRACAASLGIEEAICMLDFMVSDGRIVLLELAPRPGGDCLPQLLRHGMDLDMLKLQLDFCRRRPLPPPPAAMPAPMVGMRIHARRKGTIQRIRTGRIQRDPRLKECHLIRRPGHAVRLPPEDYESWLLGHLIFMPDPTPSVETQCMELAEMIRVEIA